ncbi:MAG: hypothetical protein KJ626_14700 [Verrucomicrobia bacterium]|nr:hypothetical protein [Verrucomicrobiota bacterium]
MTAISTKPVKQCKDCRLNLVKRCAVFEHPVLKWKKHACEGFNNPQFIEIYEKMRNPEGAHARKQERAQKAKLAHTESHHDGQHPPWTA